MKIYRHLPTGRLYPARGSQTGFEPRRTRMKWFVVGQGWQTTPLNHWQVEDAPDLPDRGAFTLAQFREYAKAYGLECAAEFLWTCDYMKLRLARLMLDPAYPDDETTRWCIATFEIDPRTCYTTILGAFGHYSFDVLEFEKHLVKRWGYSENSIISMRDFMRGVFGEENTARFERTFLGAKELTNATNGTEMASVSPLS